MSDLDLASSAAAAPSERRAALLALAWQAALPIALVVLLLGFAAVDSAVLTPGNLVNIMQQASYLALFAMAQTVVILTRGFDLALGPPCRWSASARRSPWRPASPAGRSRERCC